MTIEDLAIQIADYLFSNGQGEKAQRLVLTVDTPKRQDLGGWNKAAVIEVITERVEAFLESAH